MRLHLNTVSPEPSRHSYIQRSEVVEDSDPTFRPYIVPTKSDSDVIFCIQLLSKH